MSLSNICEDKQRTVHAYLACGEEERTRKKDNQEVLEAFLHIYDCMAAPTNDPSNPSCGELWYAVWKDQSKQSRTLRFLMRMARKESPLPIAVHSFQNEFVPLMSYPPSLN